MEWFHSPANGPQDARQSVGFLGQPRERALPDEFQKLRFLDNSISFQPGRPIEGTEGVDEFVAVGQDVPGHLGCCERNNTLVAQLDPLGSG